MSAGPEKDEEGGVGAAVAVKEEGLEVDSLKKSLVDSFYGTDRGLRATSETRAEIVELITLLEGKNRTQATTDRGPQLAQWEVDSGLHLFHRLVSAVVEGNPVKVDEISQTIDSENFPVQNCVWFAGPLATTSFSTNAKFEVQSPKRIKFEEGITRTPQLTDSIIIPENVESFGQRIDLSPFKGIITSVQDTASLVVRSISNQPTLKFSLSSSNAESWLLTTYLDEELHISRGDAGSVFVLIKWQLPVVPIIRYPFSFKLLYVNLLPYSLFHARIGAEW